MNISEKITLFTTFSIWIEGESIRQLERIATLPALYLWHNKLNQVTFMLYQISVRLVKMFIK